MLAAIDSYKKVIPINNVGLYIRLSDEDDEKKNGFSESVTNQKDLLTRFVLENDWNLVDIYIDDGFTGTNFNRPGFQRMIRDIENKRITTVITKDMSRLGRDYIETGHYIERYFPEHNVRYIAVNDRIDTFNENCNNDMSPFMAIMNDYYSKETSKKIKSHLNTKKRAGKFIGAFAPYGYQKSSEDKNKLIIDVKTAPVIKKIFEMFTSGHGYMHIASILEADGILSPQKYKSLTTNYKNARAKYFSWTAETVKSILINPTYAGNLTQNRSQKVNYKSKKLKLIPREKWIIIENTHEPIVESCTFELAQTFINRKSSIESSNEKFPHLLSGLLFCGDCGSRMTFARPYGDRIYCICMQYKRFNTCSRHTILESTVEKLVFEDLQRISIQATNKDRLIKIANNKPTKNKILEINIQIGKIESRLVEIRNTIKTLYEDKLRNIIIESDFMSLSQDFNQERIKLTEKLFHLNWQKANAMTDESGESELVKKINELVDFKCVDKSILTRLITRIEIFEDKTLQIKYKFKNPFA